MQQYRKVWILARSCRGATKMAKICNIWEVGAQFCPSLRHWPVYALLARRRQGIWSSHVVLACQFWQCAFQQLPMINIIYFN